MMSSSIARKVTMSLSGIFLITFLVVHLAINLLTLSSDPELFNAASHFMATNPVVQIMQYVLALGFLVHIIMGIVLTRQNEAARPQKYAHNNASANSSFSSRNMIITGILVLAFLVLHLRNYFYELKFGDMTGIDDYELVTSLFKIWYYVVIYVASFVFLGVHLNHGFQSAFQSIGVNHSKYTPLIKKSGTAFCILMAAGFSLIAIYHFIC